MLKLVGPLAAIAHAGLLMMTVVLVALLAKVSTDPSRPIQVVLGAATPIPSLNEPPAFSAAYAERRICVDSATSRAGYLDGRETVGGVVTATCARRDQQVVVSESRQRFLKDPYHKDQFTCNEPSDSFTCPQGQTLKFIRIPNIRMESRCVCTGPLRPSARCAQPSESVRGPKRLGEAWR